MSINSLINAGYAASDILDVLSNKNAAAGKKIRRALTLGYSASTILNKMMGGKEEDEQNYVTHEQKTDAAIKKQRKDALKGTAMVALGIAGGIGALLSRSGASLAAQGATGAAQDVLQNASSNADAPLEAASSIGSALKNPQASPLSREGIIEQAEKLQNRLNETELPLQSSSSSIQSDNPFDYYKTSIAKNYPQLTKFVEKHREAGVSPEETYEKLKSSKLLGPIAQKFEKETGHPFLNAINQIHLQKEVPTSILDTDIVISPFGAGKFHKTKDGNAYVEVEGKLRKVPENELHEPQPDVIKAVGDILKIPEIDRSSNVALFLYDPTESKAIFQFHDGSAYKYLDIDPEIVKKISEKEATPITQGENVYGAWSPHDKHGSLGAALWSYLLKNPKYAKSKKGEPENPNYMKLDTLYDYWEKLRNKKRHRS